MSFSAKRLLFVVTMTGIISACATNPDRYRNVPTAKICIDLINLPTFNLNHESRAAEVQRRGEDCSNYMGQALAWKEAEAKTRQAEAMNRPVTVEVRQAPVRQQSLNCTTMSTGSGISSTNCY